MKKHTIKVLLPILLAALFLLNTLTVMAVEADGAPPAESPAVTESVTDSGQHSSPDEPEPEPEPEEIPNDAPSGDSEGGADPPKDSIPEEPPLVRAEVGTFEELCQALEASTSQETTRIRLTSNITIPAIEAECHSKPDHPIELDLGPYTLYVEGTLRLQSGLTLTGSPGEDALIRVRPGGFLHIHDVEIQAGDRYAVWQEEGAAFTFTPMPDFSGNIRFADKNVAMPHSFLSWKVAMPVAVVHDGQTLADILPDTDSVHLFRNDGTDEPADIAVEWDMDNYQAELETRTRTLITGSYPDATPLHQPVCLVVFQNGNPATFLDTYGTESYGWPKAKVKIELMEPELGCRFEWSQDGESWLPADAMETPTWDGRLAFTVSFPQETPPTYPYYLSAVVDYPDGSTGYSDVIVIRESDSECGSGGNRHGGTGVTPPELPPPGSGMVDGDDGMDGIAPDEPDHSEELEDSEPPSGGGIDKPTETPPLVVNPPVENDAPEQSIPPTETPEQSVSPFVSDPPAQSTPPVIETPAPPLVTEPPPAAVPDSPYSGQAGDGTSASMISSAGPEPSPSAVTQTPDATLSPEPQTTADVQETPVPVVTETETPARGRGAPSTKIVVQVAVGITATGGIIVLTMTWGIWSKRLIDLLHKLLKR